MSKKDSRIKIKKSINNINFIERIDVTKIKKQWILKSTKDKNPNPRTTITRYLKQQKSWTNPKKQDNTLRQITKIIPKIIKIKNRINKIVKTIILKYKKRT